MHSSLNKQKHTKSLSTQASWYFTGRAASYFVLFLVPVILVRTLSKDDYGYYAQFLLIYNFFFTILQFGFHKAFYFFFPKYENSKRYFVTNTYIIFLIAGIFVLFSLTVFKENIAQLFNASYLSSLLSLCGLHILFMLLACPFEDILVIESKAEKAALVAFLSQVFRGIFIITFVLIFKTLSSAIIGLICYSFLRFLSYSIFVQAYFEIVIDNENINYLKQQVQYAAPLGLAGIFKSINSNIDRIILAAFFTPEVFAVYTVGKFKIPFIDMFFNSVSEVALPRLVELLKNNRVQEFLKLWKKLIIRLSVVGIGTFFFLQIVAYDLITLIFTDKYESSIPVFRIILLLVLGPMMLYGNILRAMGHTNDIFKSYFLAFILSIPLTYFMVKHFGLIGAAISGVSAYYVNAISQLFFSVRRLGKKFMEVFPISIQLKIGIICIFISVILFNVQYFLQLKALRIITSSVVFWIAYLFICYKTGVFNIFKEKLFVKILQRFSFIKT